MPTVSIDGGELWYDAAGSGPPLVCLHGGWQDRHSWQRQVDHFADDYRVLTVDLRGHGRTGPTDSRRYSIDLFADDLERLLDSLGAGTPLLAGISIGGMVVQSYLDRHPDSARGAVIAGPLQSMPPIDLPQSMKQVFSPLPALTGMLNAVGPTATFKTMIDFIQLTNGGEWLTVDESVRAQSMNALEEVSPSEFRKIFRALYEFEPPSLSHVSTPTLVLYGDRETPLVKRQGDRLSRTVINGQYREIPRSGHLVNQDQPAAFNDACATFFDSLITTDEQAAAD